MTKITLLSVFVFAASAMFAQTANPTKNNSNGSNQSAEVNKPKSTADVKGAGVNNPVGKNGGNNTKPVTVDKVNTKKPGATTNTTTTNKN